MVVYTCCGCELNFTYCMYFFLSFFLCIVSLWVYLKRLAGWTFFGKHLGHESLLVYRHWRRENLYEFMGNFIHQVILPPWPDLIPRHWRDHVKTAIERFTFSLTILKGSRSQNCQAFIFIFLMTPFLPTKTCIFRDKLITNPRSLTNTSLKSWWVFPDFFSGASC